MPPDVPAGVPSGRFARLLRRAAAPSILGALTVAGYAPFGLYWLPWLTLAALFFLARQAAARDAAITGYAFGAGLFLAGVSWVYVSLHVYGGMDVPVAALFTLVFCAILACYPAAALAAMGRMRGSPYAKALLLFPALWAITEWIRGWLFSGFPWLAVGYSQVPSGPLAGFAPVLGVYGISLATAAVAGAIALVVDGMQARRAKAAGARKEILAGALVAIVLVAGGAGLKPHAWTQPVAGEPTSVTLLQGNIPQEMKWRPERAIATLETYLGLTREAPGKLILLPETALPMLSVDIPPDYLRALAAVAVRNGGDLLYGVPEVDASGSYFNSVMSAGSAPAQTYRKHHLVPFGDYFPMQALLGWIMRLMHIPMSDFSHGPPVQKPMAVAGQKVAVNICYEDAFGEEIIRQLPEATLLANFTNDAWWGDTIASRQHLQIAQARALETGRPMLRATNTGITAIIGPDGYIVASAPEFTTSSVNGEVRGRTGSTPYVVFGNAGFLSIAAVMLLAPALARIASR